MLRFLFAILLAVGPSAFADSVRTIKFHYSDADLIKVIADYSQASGQKFVVDPAVKGRTTIMNPEPITTEEAFNALSTALATNGYAVSKQGDTMVISTARNIQRNLIEVATELPQLKPEKMMTYIVNLKFVTADDVIKHLRYLSSRDGELVPFQPRNQLVITDWVSNLHRISAILSQVDQPSGKNSKVRSVF